MVNNATTIFSAINTFVKERFNVKNIDLVSIYQIEQGIEKAPYHTFLRMLYVLKLVLLQKNGESDVDIEKVIAENQFFFYHHLWFSLQIQNFTFLIQESKEISIDKIETKKNIKENTEQPEKKEIIQSENKTIHEDVEPAKKKIVVTNRPGIKIIAPKVVAIDTRKKENKKDEIEVGQKKSFTTPPPIIKTPQQNATKIQEQEIKKLTKEVVTTPTPTSKTSQQKTTEVQEQEIKKSADVIEKEMTTTVAPITKTPQQKTTEIKEQEIKKSTKEVVNTPQQKATEIEEQKIVKSADVVEKEISITATSIIKTPQQNAT